MSHWLPTELYYVIYNYASNVDLIDKLIKSNINIAEKQRVINCIIALLISSTLTIIAGFVLRFPHLQVVNVPIDINTPINGNLFSYISYYFGKKRQPN